MVACVMLRLKLFQLLKPIGGVRASVSPATIRRSRDADPSAFAAVSRTTYVPAAGVVPLMMRVAGFMWSPGGSPWAVILIGRTPVTGT